MKPITLMNLKGLAFCGATALAALSAESVNAQASNAAAPTTQAITTTGPTHRASAGGQVIVNGQVLVNNRAGIAVGSNGAAAANANPPATAPAGEAEAAQAQAQQQAAQARIKQQRAMNIANFANMQRQQLTIQKQQIDAQPLIAKCKLDELISVKLTNGYLDVDPGTVEFKSGQNRYQVEGCSASWSVNTNMEGKNVVFGASGGGEFWTLTRYDWDKDKPGEIWRITFNIGHGLSLNGQGIDSNVYYNQNPGACTLTANDNTNQLNVNVSGASLVELQAQHPVEVRKYLIPLLARLCDHDILAPGPADVYSVFTDIAPDPEAAKRLSALLPKLGADDFASREKASKELEQLGPAGILATLRLDKESLTAEQHSRIESYLAKQRRWSVADPAQARGDLNFLISAMRDPDPAVVTQVQRALADLVGHAVELPAATGGEKQIAALDELRVKLQKELESRTSKPANPKATNSPHPAD